ncbi:hypothetical protein KR100_14495 [Synechococcus sp. KORDI-100]|nr:hypothetical protein KR100_14495 [Synechococcus sp. KORDI-100]
MNWITFDPGNLTIQALQPVNATDTSISYEEGFFMPMQHFCFDAFSLNSLKIIQDDRHLLFS